MARADVVRRGAAALAAVACAVGLGSCGLQGPLYLPAPQTAQKKNQTTKGTAGKTGAQAPSVPAADAPRDQVPQPSP
jgi:predicted small lipoprotein YifL